MPQAWASGAVVHLMASLAGLSPNAPDSRLVVSPAIPGWLNDVVLKGLPIGTASVDLRLSGDKAEVTGRRSPLRVEASGGVLQPSAAASSARPVVTMASQLPQAPRNTSVYGQDWSRTDE